MIGALDPVLKVVCNLDGMIVLKSRQSFWHDLVGHGSSVGHVTPLLTRDCVTTRALDVVGTSGLVLNQTFQTRQMELVVAESKTNDIEIVFVAG